MRRGIGAVMSLRMMLHRDAARVGGMCDVTTAADPDEAIAVAYALPPRCDSNLRSLLQFF